MTTVTNLKTAAVAFRRLPPLPVAMSDIEDADMLHETACDVYDIATRELDAARDALTEAARRLTDAEDEWSRAGAAMNDAARHVSGLRQAAGVVRTADGYRPVSA
jgi:hypothetical protein